MKREIKILWSKITEKTVMERLDGMVIKWLDRKETPAEKRALDKKYGGDFVDLTTKQ